MPGLKEPLRFTESISTLHSCHPRERETHGPKPRPLFPGLPGRAGHIFLSKNGFNVSSKFLPCPRQLPQAARAEIYQNLRAAAAVA